jgi:hypothetical protein
MKTTFLIAASLIATAAIAQDTTPAPAQPPMDTAAPAPAPMDATAPMTNASPPASTVAPPAPDTSNYPPCSRTVHDRCVQTHELARKARGHR